MLALKPAQCLIEIIIITIIMKLDQSLILGNVLKEKFYFFSFNTYLHWPFLIIFFHIQNLAIFISYQDNFQYEKSYAK